MDILFCGSTYAVTVCCFTGGTIKDRTWFVIRWLFMQSFKFKWSSTENMPLFGHYKSLFSKWYIASFFFLNNEKYKVLSASLILASGLTAITF